MKEIKVNDWMKEGKERFGESMTEWQFVCPACKTVQTIQDLIDAGVKNEDLDGYMAFSCIGRFTKGEKGCDWTLGGLFQLHTIEVLLEDGGKRRVFEFAETEKEEEIESLRVDESIREAVDMWLKHGIKPGSCTEFLLRGDYERAFKHAHPFIKQHWNDYIAHIESLPEDCRGENFDTWKGRKG